MRLICPKCGSVNVVPTGAAWDCRSCGYTGSKKRFSGGGPQPRHKIRDADAPSVPLGYGARRKEPSRYDD